MARDYIAETHPASCFFLRTYNNLNSDYGIACGGISEMQDDIPPTRFTGTLIVSSSVADGIGWYHGGTAARRVFGNLTPTAKLGGSALLVYEGTFDLSPIAAAELSIRAAEVGEQQPQLAFELAQRAAELDPSNGDAHVQMCAGYRILGEQDKAEQECNLGLALVRKDPQYGPEQVRYLEEFINRNGLKIYNSDASR
jgi:hypothetical protein